MVGRHAKSNPPYIFFRRENKIEWNELLRGQRGETGRLMAAEGAKGRYARIEIDLSLASSDGLLELTGDYIGVTSITGEGTCKIRLDHRHAQQIDLREVQEISSPFGKIYFECDGVGGLLTLYVGGALTARLKPIQSKVSIRNMEGTDVNLVEDKRFTSHTIDHQDRKVQVTINVADPVSGVIATPVSLKVKYAIIGVDTADVLFGGPDVTNLAGAHAGLLAQVGQSLAVEYCDLKDLWFVNEDGAVKPYISVLYVGEK